MTSVKQRPPLWPKKIFELRKREREREREREKEEKEFLQSEIVDRVTEAAAANFGSTTASHLRRKKVAQVAFYQKMVEIEIVKTNEGLKSRMAKVIIFLLNLRRLSFGKIAIIILSITHLHFSHTHSPSLVLSFSFSLSLSLSLAQIFFHSLPPSFSLIFFFLSFPSFIPSFRSSTSLFFSLCCSLFLQTNLSFCKHPLLLQTCLELFSLSVINDF